MRFTERLIVATLAAALPLAAGAATTCTASGASMNLGAYTGDTSTPTDAIGTFAVRCTRDGGPQNMPVTLGIGASATSGAIAVRQMKQVGGADVLSYNLYRDALRQNVWGQAFGVDTVTQTLSIPNKSSATFSFNIYGRIPGLQSVYAGAYGDSLVVTFWY